GGGRGDAGADREECGHGGDGDGEAYESQRGDHRLQAGGGASPKVRSLVEERRLAGVDAAATEEAGASAERGVRTGVAGEKSSRLGRAAALQQRRAEPVQAARY